MDFYQFQPYEIEWYKFQPYDWNKEKKNDQQIKEDFLFRKMRLQQDFADRMQREKEDFQFKLMCLQDQLVQGLHAARIP